MRAIWKFGLASIIIASLIACQFNPRASVSDDQKKNASADPFVRVVDGQFYRFGEPYYYVGTNIWYGGYLGVTPKDRERLGKELDLLKSVGIDNLRVLAISEQSTLTMSINPGIQQSPGELSEEFLIGLDVFLDELSKRDMVAVLYLNNFWQWSGGMSQYMSWVTGQAPFDPDTTGDWNGFMQNSAKFYRNDQAQGWFRQVIESLITRTNTVNGKKYTEDSAIMAWQLANEPRPGSDEDGRPYYAHYKNWIVETAKFIKSLDANHLLSTGSEGSLGKLRDIELYKDAHDIAEVDYLTFHLWPKNWSWLDINDIEGSYPLAVATAKAYILQHIDIASQLGKPTVLEEFGIERDNGDFSSSSSTEVRDRFFTEIFSLLETQMELGANIAGTNFWAWGGFGEAAHSDYIWQPGDLYTGDPPQEPQGLNSVFHSDTTTLNILHQHSKNIRAIK